MSFRTAIASAAVAVLALAGCGGPTHGTVYATPHYPAHWSTWSTSECVAYMSVSRSRRMVVNGRTTTITYTARNCSAHALISHRRWYGDDWQLCLDDAGNRGCMDVPLTVYAAYPVGSVYPGR